MNPFVMESHVSNRPWISVSDLKPIKNGIRFIAGTSQFTNRMPVRLREEAARKKIIEHRHWITNVKKEIEQLWSSFYKPCIFMLLDPAGIVIESIGSESLTHKMNTHDIGIGTSFALEHAGITAISLANQLNKTSVVKGSEHNFAMFHEWACVCTPIRSDGNTHGYLGVALHVEEEIYWVVPFLELVIKHAVEKLIETDPVLKRERIYESFNSFGLTPREKEIGYYILQDYTANQIAEVLIISKETVRTVMKSIYTKTEIHSKGQFITKFLS